jgi:hypothetical protein
MKTYLALLDDYLYTMIYKYVWDDVMNDLVTDHAHVTTFIDTFYSAGCQHKLYKHINDEYLTRRLFIFYTTQIRNGKSRRGSDQLKELFHYNIIELSHLTVYNDPEIYLTPLYQTRFGSLFKKRNGNPPPVVGYLIRTLLTINGLSKSNI